MALPACLVLVDLETTGAHLQQDRITEIALIRLERGEVTARWQSLVNPQCAIPGLIQQLVGISNDMVATAPTFEELAQPFRQLCEGAVFVAHNARFDYGFIYNAYQRLGQTFEAPVLCTLKLSRVLYPNFARHGLDALIGRHGFRCEARHRAMGDAAVLLQFLQRVEQEFPFRQLMQACDKAMKRPRQPAAVSPRLLAGLPDAPGVYQFFGE